MRALCFQETTGTLTKLAPWLSTEEMQAWVRKARDKASYQRRLAIWLTAVERLSAHRVASRATSCMSKDTLATPPTCAVEGQLIRAT